jgi:hypothetical protein
MNFLIEFYVGRGSRNFRSFCKSPLIFVGPFILILNKWRWRIDEGVPLAFLEDPMCCNKLAFDFSSYSFFPKPLKFFVNWTADKLEAFSFVFLCFFEAICFSSFIWLFFTCHLKAAAFVRECIFICCKFILVPFFIKVKILGQCLYSSLLLEGFFRLHRLLSGIQ